MQLPTIAPISIDLSELAKEFSLKQDQVDELGAVIAGSITDRIYYNWQNQAKRSLRSTRDVYLKNLNIGQITPLRKFIILTGKLPNMLEDGVGAFDMKQSMLNSPKAKTSKSGKRYITIPFRHASADSLGENSAFSDVMPPTVEAIVKRLQPKRTVLGAGFTMTSKAQALSFDKIPKQFQIPNSRPAVSNLNTQKSYSAYEHKSPIYEGMIREEKTYEKATQSQYVTFRRISENSDVNSWIHRGIISGNFAQKGLNETDIGGITDRAVDSYLEKQDV